MKCPKCNTFNNNSANFCRNCGEKFVKCPVCGSVDIEDDESGYLQYTCNSCGHTAWGHTDVECPECGSDDVWDANTGKHPYTCNACGHNWGDDNIDEDENIRPSSVPTNSTNEGPAWLGCLFMILGVVGIGLGLGFILYLLGF